MVKIKRQIISSTNYKNGTDNPAKFITLHMTGNTSPGADAQAHANLQSNGNSRNASWHWQVDDKVAIQSFNHYMKLWHASDGQGSGNNESIGIEGCVNSDGNFNQMMKNYVELVVHVMKECNIKSTNNIVTHYWWSGKNCPTQMFQGKNGWTFDYFIQQVQKAYNGHTVNTKGWKRNAHGTWWKNKKGSFTNGNEEIQAWAESPSTVWGRKAGKLQPGAKINFDEIILQDGLNWLGYTAGNGIRLYLPIRKWNKVAPPNYKVGKAWGQLKWK